MMAAMTLPPLNATSIVDALSASAAAMFAVEVYDSVGSTNDVARAFFYSEMYYQALQVEMEKDITAFRKVIEEKDHLKQLINPVPRP